MTRRRRKRRRRLTFRRSQSSAALRHNGMQAFKRGDFTRAIKTWERIKPPTSQPNKALAEAYFRRGLGYLYGRNPQPQTGLADLQKASTLQSDDPGYTYHLGLAAHHQGDLEEATLAYEIALQSSASGRNRFSARVAYPLALALLQQGKDPTTHPAWSNLSPNERTMLQQVNAFRRRPYKPSPDAPLLYRGLAAADAREQERACDVLNQVLEAPGSPTEKGLAHYYLGTLAARDENWDEAKKQWTAAYVSGLRTLHLQSNLTEIYQRLAEEHLQNDDGEGDSTRNALAAAVEAARHKPGDKRINGLISQARQRLAYRAAIAGKWETAEEHWREAAGAEGGSFRLAYNLALAYERSEDFHKAGETWREALRRRPRRADHPDAITGEQIALLWKRSAEAYRSAGDYDEAVHVYKQAVKYNPDNLDTRLELSEMLVVAGRIQAAQNELDRVIQRDPDNITALLRQGELHVANASWWRGFQAPKYWRRVLEIDPDNLQARQLLADFYIDQARNNISWANYGAAIPNYQKALEYLPKNGVAMAGIGHCYLQLRNEPQAQFWFDRALETTPANLQVYDEIIHAWLDAKNPDQAWQVMAQAESHIPSIPHDFYQTQAAYCLELNRSDWARPWLKRAVETAPPGANVLVKIGEMAVMLDAHEIAKEYLDRAIKAGQYPGQAYLMLGIMHAKQNDLKTAEKHWSEAEKIAHKNRDNELTERIEIARTIFTGPQGFFDLLMRGLGPPGFNPFEDFDPFGNEDEYDDYW